ncbi:hypothetical protein TNCV_3336281 [Trichonephila clavipes]|nr:hypothetical protein TNCV_3336281 [Trichonephila clavipes]
MGASSLVTIMTASMGVGTPARAQTINNGPMATCTGHLTVGEAIKLIMNRRMRIHNNRRRHMGFAMERSRKKGVPLFWRLN